MSDHVCPWWVGYWLASPLRRLRQKPEIILAPYVQPGMSVLDVGCAMGFFTLPLARMVGDSGKVIAVDLQERMIKSLLRRARRRGLTERIETRICPADSLGIDDLAGQIDFTLAFAVVHEIPDPVGLMADLYRALKPDGRLLVSEPTDHVKPDAFETTVKITQAAGFTLLDRPEIKRGISAVFGK